MDFTAHWHWPQWAFVIWIVLSLLITADRHGKEMRTAAGPEKGEVQRHNFGVSLIRAATWLFILIAGGFFA